MYFEARHLIRAEKQQQQQQQPNRTVASEAIATWNQWLIN